MEQFGGFYSRGVNCEFQSPFKPCNTVCFSYLCMLNSNYSLKITYMDVIKSLFFVLQQFLINMRAITNLRMQSVKNYDF